MRHLFLLTMLILCSIPAFAQSPPAQTTQDYADGNRLVINNKRVFVSGMNIAWNNFARDVGDNAVSISAFVNQFKQIKNADGNAVRWWLHTDGQTDPKFNESTGAVTGLGSKTISNIQQVLDSAYAYGIVVSLTLFSFDLLDGEGGNKTSAVVARNEKFLTVPANLDSYITNALKPMLQAVGSHPAIMCWEVFNEPEGMSSDAGGWSSRKIAMSHVLRFTAKIAAEVHRSTKKMASTGIHEYAKMKTHYSDAKLKTASGTNDELAYLDFYMAHYYPEHIGASGSPFHHPASYWGMDRPILIGEFPARDWGPGTGYVGNSNGAVSGTAMTVKDAFEYAYNNGYAGAMSWSMYQAPADKFGDINTTKPALENLYAKHPEDIRPTGAAASSSSSSRNSSSSHLSSSSRSSSSSLSSSSSRSSSSSLEPSSSSSSDNTTIVLNSAPSAKFGVRSLNHGTLLVESNANTEIHLYNANGNIVQKLLIPAGSSMVKVPIPAGIYIVKNTKTGQAQRVLMR